MNCKSITILIFLGITSQSWSQQDIKEKGDEKPDTVKNKIILVKEEADTAKKENYIADAYSFPFIQDTVSDCDTMRINIIYKALDYLGVKYRYGQSSENGFDCSGFIKFIYESFGFFLPHSSFAQYKMSKHLEIDEAQSGDLVFFITRGNRISHVGLYLGNNQFVHSPGKGRTVSIDTLDTGYYKKHLVCFGSILDL